jgi:purine-binding chemotaxis protein CheW
MSVVIETQASESAGAPPIDNEAARQFVTFRMEKETFAVPLIEVQEIIRLPDIVEVPRSARHLKGLANLRGSVLPVINLRQVFGMSETVADDSTRVVVMNAGTPIGFVVDRMERVIAADPREVESVGGIRATVDAELLQGVVKRADGMVMILDTARLLQGGGEGKARSARSASANVESLSTKRGEGEASDEIRLVSFEVDGQEYALPIESVEEIVQLPDHINALPNSRQHLLGVMNLRNRMLPLVSLRSMFGLPAPDEEQQSRIVVVSHEIAGASHSVGLVTDTVKEVLRAPKSAVDPVPRLIASQSGQQEVESLCRLEEGKRLVSIMAPERLFLNDQMGGALDEGAAGEDNAMTSPQRGAEQRADDEEQFVIFTLADEEYGVPIDAVQEIVRVPEQITRMPKTPAFVEGIINLRGSVMPIIDQRRRFGLPDMAHNDRQRIVVFVVKGVRTGFIVDSVSEVLKVSRAQISDAPDLAGEHDGAVGRVANLVDAKRLILMLDAGKLLSESEIASLSGTH